MISKKTLPSALKSALRNYAKNVFNFKEKQEFLNDFFEQRNSFEKQIPKHILERKHINKLEVLVDRFELLTRMPKGGVVAELGVNKGDFSEAILAITRPAKFHLIDVWGDSERYHDGLKLIVDEKFKNEIIVDQVQINVGLSTKVLADMPDFYFDWVYLDTDHSYSTTANELSILKTKVKPGGIIAGHDYVIGNWLGGVRYGVIEAVHEMCVKENWELIYITVNVSEMPSFAIRKIG